MATATSGRRAERRITPGTHVSGSHGELRSNPDIRRRVKERMYGHVVEAVGSDKYKVLFDNGKELVCPSRRIQTERATASIPIIEAASANNGNTSNENTAEENIANKSSSNNETDINTETGIHHNDDCDILRQVIAVEGKELAEEGGIHGAIAEEEGEPVAEGETADIENEESAMELMLQQIQKNSPKLIIRS